MWRYNFVTFIFISSLLICLSIKIEEEETTKEEPKHPKLEEYAKQAGMRPTKCQVCRVLGQELWITVNSTNHVKQNLFLSNRLDGADRKSGMKIEYQTSELRLMDILETLCRKVYDYKSIAGPDFPYLKGVKSMFRQQLDQAMGTSGLKLTLDAPAEIIDDPTLELRRMYFMCNQMIEEHEDEIIQWYTYKQQTDPVDFLCAERIVDSEKQDCLKASTEIPEFAKIDKKKLDIRPIEKTEL